MDLIPELKQRIEATLARFPFVQWDRFATGLGTLEVYGWIDRPDTHKDFVCLFFYDDGDVTYSTSSARHSLEIFRILNDGKSEGHAECKRVEDHFSVANMVRLPRS